MYSKNCSDNLSDCVKDAYRELLYQLSQVPLNSLIDIAAGWLKRKVSCIITYLGPPLGSIAAGGNKHWEHGKRPRRNAMWLTSEQTAFEIVKGSFE
jgi:TPP-dependent indolepyruvate ferredoxin oxidoreductase alpha subunit